MHLSAPFIKKYLKSSLVVELEARLGYIVRPYLKTTTKTLYQQPYHFPHTLPCSFLKVILRRE
jgi:hypothetical protein